MDLVTLSNNDTTVSICASRGAEVSSVVRKGVELVHRGNNFEAATGDDWYGHGQLLWPAVGRHRDGKYGIDGKTMPLHGFAKDVPFKLIGRGDVEGAQEVRLRLTSAEAGHKDIYPFDFELDVTYRLCPDGQLVASHTVRNTGNVDLPFAIGNHISLRFPFDQPSVITPDTIDEAQAGWASGRVISTVTHQLTLAPGSLLDGGSRARPEFKVAARAAALDAPGVTDGVFAHVDGLDAQPRPALDAAAAQHCELSLEQPGVLAVSVTNEWTETPSTGPHACHWTVVKAHRYFVLWGMPPDGKTGRSGFLCPEPWVSGPDSLNTRVGLPVLSPRQHATWTWTLTAKDLEE